MEVQVTSAAFSEGGDIPARYSCDGEDISPPLKWGDAPDGTRSFVVICEDPDAPSGTFVHWLLYDLPATATELPEAIPNSETLFNGAKQGRNDFKRIGYGGPCPPRGGPHRYFFRLYALDIDPQLKPLANKAEIARAMEGHVIASGHLMGKYKRD
jgi:Raf kinase inhibitor-like YbhB/YbcL family protein